MTMLMLPLWQPQSQATQSSDEFKRWLKSAVGREEAATVFTLPEDLRETLYSNILWYGPAGEQVAAVFHGVQSLGDESEGHPAWSLFSQLTKKSFELHADCYKDDAEALTRLGVENFASYYALDDWVKLNGYDGLDENFSELILESGIGWSDHATGVRILLWFLTGQHLFTPQLMEKLRKHVPLVNSILAEMGIEDLSGRFTSISSF